MSSRRESQMSVGSDNPLPDLKSAKLSNIQINKEYKSGASYKGQTDGNCRAGKGLFTWPNGAQYEGEFVNNVRHGKGVQQWADGSKYDGEFVDDLRHGQGTHSWSNGEEYSGKFFKDRRHGSGTYKWPDDSCYSGTFYMDRKEGYGLFKFANGNEFEGLYQEDEREGPGVLTYTDGKQDVGLWHRENLVKLCSPVARAFTMKDHKEFDYFPEDHQLIISSEPTANQVGVIDKIINPQEEFAYEPRSDLSKQASSLFSGSLTSKSTAVDLEAFDKEFFQEAKAASAKATPANSRSSSAKSTASNAKSRSSSAKSTTSSAKSRASSAKSTKSNSSQAGRVKSAEAKKGKELNEGRKDQPEGPVIAWNNTPSFVAMQKHILKHKCSQGNVSFEVKDIVNGDRSKFKEKGPIEEASELFLSAAMKGDLKTVEDMLNSGKAYVDVADRNGHTPLLGASVNWYKDVINCLLDNGADVNRLNDEGVSALAACHVYFYPIESFHYNIAERYLEKPPEVEEDSKGDPADPIKGILQKKKSVPPPTRQSQLEAKKIKELRQSYAKGPDASQVTTDSGIAGTDSTVTDPTVGKPDGDNNAERKLGTLNVKRVVRINIDDMMEINMDQFPDPDFNRLEKAERSFNSDEGSDVTTVVDDFESNVSVENFPIDVSDQMIERCATHLSQNNMVVGRARSAGSHAESLGTVRRLAIDKSNQQLMESTIRLLLRRGADPNTSIVPMPVLFFAIKAGDVDAVRLLLIKGASTGTRLSEKKGGLAPLHIAVAIPGEEGVQITELLLNSLADPDVRATEDDSFLNRNLEEEWSKDVISDSSKALLGGRTPLHIACARDDNYKYACRVVHLLLDHHANPDLLCNGHSPLALCVRSGNDLAVDELLVYNADLCLPLSHGVGSALCIASSTEYEHRRTPQARLQLIDKLINAGADILAPIPIGPKRVMGTSVDYAYYMYNLDRRIAHMPYHALTHAERETFNARRKLLSHVGDILRLKAIEREQRRRQEEELEGRRSRSPSPNFLYMGSGQDLPPGMKAKNGRAVSMADGKVSFQRSRSRAEGEVRKPMLRYCYECGRSVGVRLSACTRCKEVYYCSKACKLKAWNARHKEECIRLGGRSPSPRGKDKRIDSPTPATDPDKNKPTTIPGIISGDQRIKLPLLKDTRPNVFMKGGHTDNNNNNDNYNTVAPPKTMDKNNAMYRHGNVAQPPNSKSVNPSGQTMAALKDRGLLSNKQVPMHMKHRSKSAAFAQIKPKWMEEVPENAYIGNYSFV